MEASKANDEIGEIGIDGSVEKDATNADDKSSIGRSKQSQSKDARDTVTPSKLESNHESKENLHSPGQVDWSKVGKIYKPESAIQDILQSEMGRLGKAFDMAIDAQDVDLEEKYKGKKK